MATFTMQMVVGAIDITKQITPTNARVQQFADDLIEYYPEIDDGGGGTRPMTQTEAVTKWLDDLMAGQVQWAKGLRQHEINAAVAVADGMLGNT